MKNNHDKTYAPRHRKSILVSVFFMAMLTLSLQAADARAAGLQPDSYRFGKVIDEFDDTWQFAVAFKLGRPKRLLAHYAFSTRQTPG